MRTRILVGLILMTTAAAVGQKAQRFDVKTGLWDVTTSATTTGELPIAASELPPEQRARVEAAMKRPHTSKHKSCITEKDLDAGNAFRDKSEECTSKMVNSTSTTAEINLTCQNQGVQSKGTIKLQALDSENVKGTTEMTASGGGHTMTSNSIVTAKWVSASCGGKGE